MIAAYLLLILPLCGILYFALVGHREDIGQQNIRFNGVSLLLSLWLAVTVFNSGTRTTPRSSGSSRICAGRSGKAARGTVRVRCPSKAVKHQERPVVPNSMGPGSTVRVRTKDPAW